MLKNLLSVSQHRSNCFQNRYQLIFSVFLQGTNSPHSGVAISETPRRSSNEIRLKIAIFLQKKLSFFVIPVRKLSSICACAAEEYSREVNTGESTESTLMKLKGVSAQFGDGRGWGYKIAGAFCRR